jgi:5-methylcytosine-specific restriction endonuclease McrA
VIDAATKNLVRQRAGNRCEYCGLHQDQSPLASLQIEHINPKKHGGTDDPDNLALACIDCNLAKSSNIAGRDPDTKQLTPLFDPRTQRWDEHFVIQGTYIVGKTAVGRTTVAVLNMNSDDQLELRAVQPRS